VRRIIALATAGVVVLLLVVAQLVLPGIAEQKLRDRLSKSGTVLSVQVSAFPAIELLWHDADKVVVKLATYRGAPGHLADLLKESDGVDSVDASAAVLDTGLLTLRDATLHKRGNVLTGHARVTESDLRRALPILDSVTPVSSSDGRLTLRGTATLFGVTATVDATVAADAGRLVVSPDVPFGGLATITVFSDPRIHVQEVSGGTAPGGMTVSARAVLQ
jgi:hypothetical protein